MGEQRKIFPFRWSEDDPFLRYLSTVIKLVVRLRLSRGVKDLKMFVVAKLCVWIVRRLVYAKSWHSLR